MSQIKSSEVVCNFANSAQAYIELLKDICSFTDDDNVNFGSVGLPLHKVRNLLYDPKVVAESIELAILDSQDFSPNSITESFTEIYPNLILPVMQNREIAQTEVEEEQEIWYQYSTFCSHTLPQSSTTETESITEYTNNKLSISCTKGLPYGGVARLIILYVNSMAVKYKSREIDIGRSIKDFVERLGYTSSYIEGGINEQVLMQLEKLFHTTYVNSSLVKTLTKDNEYILEKKDTRLHLFDGTLTWENVHNTLTTNTVAKVVLSDNYFQEILKHPVPLSLDAIKSMKKSPLALDLYAFISYRANTKRLVPAKLAELKKQFCYAGETWRFKSRVQAALKYVEKAWPECNVILKGDVLLIPKMATHISKQK